MEFITNAQLVSGTRREWENGREYLVVPISILVPGVLNGSRGPLYYPADEVFSQIEIWDRVPIVINHPTYNGQFVSSKVPGVLEKYGIGETRNPYQSPPSRQYPEGRLEVEGWFDVLETQNKNPDIWNALQEGKKIEVSTGFAGSILVEAPIGSYYKGKPYYYTATAYKSDHLAILPNDRGACSVEDGCGVFNRKGEEKNWQEIRSSSSCSCSSSFRSDTGITGKTGCSCWQPLQRSSQQEVVEMSALLTVNGEMSLTQKEDAVHSAFCEQHPYRYDPNTGSPLPRPYIVAVFDTYLIFRGSDDLLYKQEYTLDKKTAKATLASDTVAVEKVVKYVPINNGLEVDTEVGVTTYKEFLMSLSQQERKLIIEDLVTNCDCWKHQGDREVLNSFSDEKLVLLKDKAAKEKQMIAVANAAVAGFSDGNQAFRINPETGKWERRVQQGGNDNNQGSTSGSSNKSVVNTGNHYSNGNSNGGQADNSKKDDRTDILNKILEAETPRKLNTLEDWLKVAPPEVANTFKYASEIEQREKDVIINKLLVNVAESERPAQRDRLRNRSLADLRNDLALIPTPPSQEELNRAISNGSKKIQVQVNGQHDDDMLVTPVMNWQEIDGSSKRNGEGNHGLNGSSASSSAASLLNHRDQVDYEEWLKSAPSEVRNMVQNAMVIEAREKRRLIDEITANISDEDTEKRLRARLADKSIEDLKDLLALAPKKDNGRANYFGSAGAVTNRGSSSNLGNSEDVLPLPKINWSDK